jgi:hypothetical protein
MVSGWNKLLRVSRLPEGSHYWSHHLLRYPRRFKHTIHPTLWYQPGGSNHGMVSGDRWPTLSSRLPAAPNAPNANIITFDYPPDSQGMASTGTFPYAINPAWTITGNYSDAASLYHGFLRTRNGKFTSFDPQASTGSTGLHGLHRHLPFRHQPGGSDHRKLQ